MWGLLGIFHSSGRLAKGLGLPGSAADAATAADSCCISASGVAVPAAAPGRRSILMWQAGPL